jgi:hypothetical protein
VPRQPSTTVRNDGADHIYGLPTNRQVPHTVDNYFRPYALNRRTPNPLTAGYTTVKLLRTRFVISGGLVRVPRPSRRDIGEVNHAPDFNPESSTSLRRGDS